MLAKCAGPITVAVGLWNSLKVEEMGAAHESVNALEGRIPRSGGGGFTIIFVFFAEELSKGFAGLMIVLRDGVETVGVRNLIFTANPNR